jgi:hypothetical protein
MNLVEYFKELQSHDWYYEYSDDHSVWTRGKNNSRRLQSAAQENEVMLRMYKDYADYVFNKMPKPVIETYI